MNTKAKSICSLLLLAAAALFMAGKARAGLTHYTDRTAFLAALGASAQFDTYDSLQAGNVGTDLTRLAGTTAYSVSSDSGLYGLLDGGNGLLSTSTAGAGVNFSGFSNGVFGIGAYFFGTDFNGGLLTGGPGGPVVFAVTVTDGDGALGKVLVPVDAEGFLGFVSDSDDIVAMSVSVLFDGEVYTAINDLIVAQAAVVTTPDAEVPEPGSLGLAAGALALLGLARRRRA